MAGIFRRKEICGNMTLFGEFAWLTEFAHAIRRMIMTSRRHGLGYLICFSSKPAN